MLLTRAKDDLGMWSMKIATPSGLLINKRIFNP